MTPAGKSSIMDMDLVLVPCALAIILGYHILLFCRILQRPYATVIGYENHNTLAWLRRMMAHAPAPAPEKQVALALGVITDGISASNTLASLCLALPSLIGALWKLSGTWSTAAIIPGGGDAQRDTSQALKYASLLACILASFTCFVQSSEWYVRASFLMLMSSDAPASHVQRAVLRGGGFWEAGLQALYLATALLVWVGFGAVPMLAYSVLAVAVLHLLDTNSMPLH